jgi:hypothetical protein
MLLFPKYETDTEIRERPSTPTYVMKTKVKVTNDLYAEFATLYTKALELKQLDVALEILLKLDSNTRIRHSNNAVQFLPPTPCNPKADVAANKAVDMLMGTSKG